MWAVEPVPLPGYLQRWLAKKGQVIGTDVDEKYLQYCRNYKPLPNVDFMRDDISNSRLDGNFDVIYSRFMFVHLKDARKAISSMKRLAKKGWRNNSRRTGSRTRFMALLP